MRSQHINHDRGPRRRRGRRVVRLDTAALWERLALLGRSQTWLAPGDRGQPQLRLHAGQRGARALGMHPPADAQGPRRRRLSPTIHIGGNR